MTARTPAHTGSAVRVLHVLGFAGSQGARFGITGVERVVEVFLEGLDRSAFQQFVAYPSEGERAERYRALAAGWLDDMPRRRLDRAYAGRLARFIGQHGIQLVVSHGLRFDFHAALACRNTGVPHLVLRAVAFADEDLAPMQRVLYGAADAWTLRRCRSIVAVSKASKRRMVDTQHLPPEKITVVPNGVRVPEVDAVARRAAREALGIAAADTLVGAVGQLIPRKAFHRIVEAASLVKPRFPHLACMVLGEGPEREHLESLAHRLGVRLVLPGFVEDPYPAMASFDVAVLPSRAEGMPLVVLEAMALGVACLATPAAGTVEVLEDGRSGILFPADDPAALAAALEGVLGDDARRAELARAGQERVRRHFSREAMLEGIGAAMCEAAQPATAGLGLSGPGIAGRSDARKPVRP